MPFIIFPARVYSLLAGALLVGLLLTLIHRAAYFDEAWFAEQSYWFIQSGRVKSDLFRGYNNWENGLYVFHKLFIYAGALIMSVTGISVATSKLVSGLFGLLGGYFIWVHERRTTPEQTYLSLLLYFGCGTLIRYTSVNRPETMCMALGLASYLLLDLPGRSRPKPLLAGVLAGLAALTHLNGIIYLIAGTSWLVIKTGWRPTALFAVAGALTLSLYGLDALLAGKLAMLVNQFQHDPATQENLNLTAKLSVMADYHQIFFHSQNEAALSGLVILSGLLFRNYIRFSQPVFLYTLLLFFSFWLLTKSDTDIYLLLFVPWLVLLAAHWILSYSVHLPIWQRRFLRVLLALYWVVAGSQLYFVIRENKTTPDIEVHNKVLATHMPCRHTSVIAPLEFFFGQMDTYKIRGLTSYYLREREGKKIPLSTFFQLASQDTVAYIISDHRRNASYDIPPNAPVRIGNYHRIFQDQWNSIYAADSLKIP